MEDLVGSAVAAVNAAAMVTVAAVSAVAATNATPLNATLPPLPLDMTFNDGHVLSVACYPFLMIVSAVGNITVLVILLRRRKRGRSRINNMLMHLSIADLLVTFLMMPLEIAWNWTVDWRGGDALCRIMSFYRMFGLYLSGYVLVCISVDRYFAVLHPMQISDRRGRWMLAGAWVAAVICSLPQMVVFQVLPHPDHQWYLQCITKGTLTTEMAEVAYAAFGMVALYLLPLVVIIFSYASILVEIFRRSRDPIDDKLRRSSLGFLGRAKIRTLKMTIIIVLVFFVCSTPYYVMMVWYWLDRENAIKADPRLQKGLLLFASANSCMNPIVYGAFNIRTRRSASQVSIPLSALSATTDRKVTLKSALRSSKPAKPHGAMPGDLSRASRACRTRSPPGSRDSLSPSAPGSRRTIAFASPNGAAAPLASPSPSLASLGPPLPALPAVCSTCGARAGALAGASTVPDVTAVAVAREAQLEGQRR